MRMVLIAAALAALATPVRAQDPVPPDAFAWYVLNELNQYYFDIEDPTNRPPLRTEVPAGVLVPVEVNGDGRTDWLINWPDSTQFCGTGGCRRSLYISDESGGFARALDRQALDLSFVTVSGEVRLEAWVHHLNCATDESECRYAYAWDAGAGRLVQRPNSRGQTLLRGGGLDLIDPVGADPVLPEALSDEWYGGRMTCPDYSDAGFETRRPLIRDVPDLNGDGRRDWLLERPLGCDNEQSAPFQVWLSTEDDAVLAFTSAFNEYPSIDMGATPATLVVNPPCGQGESCPNVRLRWNGRQGGFVEAR